MNAREGDLRSPWNAAVDSDALSWVVLSRSEAIRVNMAFEFSILD